MSDASGGGLVMQERVVIVIPAYNEERTIVSVIRGLKAQGFMRIIVVDDNSTDQTNELAHAEGVILVRHLLNRGVGGAWGTGIKAALRCNPDIVVTFDADGQHDPDDIPQLLAPIIQGEADVVIGSRTQNPVGMPWSRRMANRLANLITFMLFGIWTTDSQSGLRALARDAAERIQFMTSGMEVCSQMIAEIARNHLRYKEVPVKAIYTAYSLSKGQNLELGLQTLAKLVLAKFRRMA
jgi:UDP-N-acetylglucosamine---dolichyl-phosphate N-acetylglucosaminyltransferase